ncbi:MAG: hypothetical protein ACI4M6_05850 [Christensenellaceae bacterium]
MDISKTFNSTVKVPIHPKSKVKLILKSGNEVEINTLFLPQDFLVEYMRKGKKMRLIVGDNSFAEIDKASVEFFQVEEV